MRSSAADGEHSSPVWAVRWQPAVAAGPRSLVFVSISSDGRLVEWALGKARMTHEVRPAPSKHAHSLHQDTPCCEHPNGPATAQQRHARGYVI